MNDENEKIEEITESCACAAFCGKGSFYPDKDYGGMIRNALENEKLLLSFVRDALKNIDGVYVKEAGADAGELVMKILINDEPRQVKIKYETDV